MICHFCSMSARVEGPHWTGTEYIRVAVCDDCHTARKLAKRPRQPRRRRDSMPATDWNMLVSFSRRGDRS